MRFTIVAPILAILLVPLHADAALSPIASSIAPFLSHLPHGPIVIDGDADFCADPIASGVVNCGAADGSAGNPFKIRGWSIQADVENLVPALSISRTTLHVVVSENLLATASDGLVPTAVLTGVRNVALHENVLRSGRAPALAVDGFAEAPVGALAHPAFEANTLLAGLVDGASISLADLAAVESATFRSTSFAGSTESHDNVDAFLVVRNSGRVVIEDSVFTRANGTGVRATNVADLVVSRTRVSEIATGFDLTGPGKAKFTLVNLSRVATGITAVDISRLTVSLSSMEDDYPCFPACAATAGIDATRTNLLLGNVTVRGFDTGVRWDGNQNAVLVAVCNHVEGNDVGFLVHDNGAESFFLNSLVGNGLALRNVGTSEFHAERNWWGTPEGPTENGPNGYAGKVNVDPFLTAPPSGC